MGLIVGLIALRRLRGIYFSIVTLGAVYVLYVMAGQYVPLFDGYNGLSGLFNPMGDALGLDFQSYQYFFLASACSCSSSSLSSWHESPGAGLASRYEPFARTNVRQPLSVVTSTC